MVTEGYYNKVWHSGDEKPQIYKDKITGQGIITYCICVWWYDSWNETMCIVTNDGDFVDVKNNKPYKHNAFDYWCYTHDIYPRGTEERYLVDISVQE